MKATEQAHRAVSCEVRGVAEHRRSYTTQRGNSISKVLLCRHTGLTTWRGGSAGGVLRLKYTKHLHPNLAMITDS